MATRIDAEPVAGCVDLYADGGLTGKNPSLGGTWAVRAVNDRGAMVAGAAGRFTAAELGLTKVSCNVAEVLALVVALEMMPDGWAGRVWSDSVVALITNHRRKYPVKWLPGELLDRILRNRERVGAPFWYQLAGHPTRADLARGVTEDNERVSEHNVWCDQQCTLMRTATTEVRHFGRVPAAALAKG